MSFSQIDTETQTPHNWPPKPVFQQAEPKPLNTLISMAVFVGVFLLIGMELRLVFVLLIVLLVHELGHFVSMKQFGYKNVNMFFVPLFGAFVSGENDDASEQETVITLLAGPVPGIFIGLILLYFEKNYNLYQLKLMPEIFISLNMLNLLPLIPLDGGRLIEAMFVNGKHVLERGFLILSLLLLALLAWKLNSIAALFISVFIILRMRSSHKQDKMRKELSIAGIDYRQSYSALSDEMFWKMETIVRNRLQGAEVPLSITAGMVRNLLQPVPRERLNPWMRLGIVLFWILCLTLPIYLYSILLTDVGFDFKLPTTEDVLALK